MRMIGCGPLCVVLVTVSMLICGASSQDSRTIRHVWAPDAYVGRQFSWDLQWKGLDRLGNAAVQSALPPGITYNSATSRFQGTFSGSAPSSYDTNLTFSSLSFGSGITLQVHFTFFPSTPDKVMQQISGSLAPYKIGYVFRDPSTLPSFTSLGPHRPRIISESLVLSPALTNQNIPTVPQNNPYTRNESIDFITTTVSSTNVVISFPDNLPTGQRAPILLWMHGNSYYGEYYMETMKIVASHGIAMVAPNYYSWSIGTGLVQQRTRLLNQALDYVYAMNNNASSLLYNKLDVTSGFVVGGHSWGGATASLYSLERRGGVRGSILMDEIAMINNADWYRRTDGLNATVPFWYTDPTPFAEIPMLYFRAPRSLFNEGITEATAAYTSSPFTTIVSVTDAFHESFLDAYPASLISIETANSTRQTAAHFIVAFMKRIVVNDLSMTDYLLGPSAGDLSARTSPFTSRGVEVTTTDRSTQLLIEDFGKIGVNALGNPTIRTACYNRTLPGIHDIVTNPQTSRVIAQSAWQWIYMNVTNSSSSVASWETQLGSIIGYSEYTRICIDVMIQPPPPLSTFVRFPQDLRLTFGFNYSSASSVKFTAGQNYAFPDLQVAVLRAACFPLADFTSPIVSISAEVQIPATSELGGAAVYMDRVRLERVTVAQPPPPPVASPTTTVSQPQSLQAPSQSQFPPQGQQGQAPTQSQSQTPTAKIPPTGTPLTNSASTIRNGENMYGIFILLASWVLLFC